MNEIQKIKTLEVDSTQYETRFTTKYLQRKAYKKKDIKVISAFIPGLIKDLFVKEGDKVAEGDKLLILEAMKMENTVFSPMATKVKKIYIKKGQRVSKEQILIDLE